MKRDMDLLRLMLLKLETVNENPIGIYMYSPDELAIEGYTGDQLAYHYDLAVEAELIIGARTNGRVLKFSRLTWSGHDFVDSVRDEEIWRKTRHGAAAAGAFSLELVRDLAKGFIKKKIADHTGIHI